MKEQSKKTVAKKKFFKMVFSRAGIFVILILIQLLVFLGIPYYLKEYATFIYSAMSVMEIVVLVYIINTEGNPAFKMTWMLCVMALPVIGTVFYIYVHHALGRQRDSSHPGIIGRRDTRHCYPPLEIRYKFYHTAKNSRQPSFLLPEYLLSSRRFPTSHRKLSRIGNTHLFN